MSEQRLPPSRQDLLAERCRVGSIEEGRGRLGNKIFVILEVKEELLVLLLSLGVVDVDFVIAALVFVGLWIVFFIVFVLLLLFPTTQNAPILRRYCASF